jgi:FkbM family methyltransferase
MNAFAEIESCVDGILLDHGPAIIRKYKARPIGQKPLLFRLIPKVFRERLYYKLLHTRHEEWPALFHAASLALCPKVIMHDLIPGDVISGSIAFTGLYEWGLTRHVAKIAQHGGLLVDVGANMGYFSLLWAGLGTTSRVIAFEASPRNVQLFSRNILANDLHDRIALVPKAAGARAGTIPFDIGPDEQTGWGGISASRSATTIDIPMVRLDETLPLAPIDLLKIDVEGADTWVLFGCERLLERRLIKTIVFEQNDRMEDLGIAPGQAQAFLQKFGYKPRCLGDGEWIAD